VTTQRQHQKGNERERRIRLRKHEPGARTSEHQTRNLYPEVMIADTDGAPEALVQAIRRGLKTFRLDDARTFGQVYCEFFRDQRSLGVKAASALFHARAQKEFKRLHRGSVTNMVAHLEKRYRVQFQLMGDVSSEQLKGMSYDMIGEILHAQLIISVGRELFEHVPEIQLFIPFVDIQVLPESDYGQHWNLYFRAMLARSTPMGPIYYSPHGPEVTVDGKTRKLGWSVHAVRRVCSRAFPTWRTYAGLGDAYAFLNDYIYCEPVVLTNGAPAVSMYLPCNIDGFVDSLFAWKIIGSDISRENEHWGIRLGYLPLAEHGDFWVAKTLLLPGFSGTPERAVLNNATLPREERRLIQDRIDHLERAQLFGDFNVSVLKWFHDNGYSQVKVIGAPIFRNYVAGAIIDDV
jgi:hypothetical protein